MNGIMKQEQQHCVGDASCVNFAGDICFDGANQFSSRHNILVLDC